MAFDPKMEFVYTFKCHVANLYLQAKEDGSVTASGKLYEPENPNIYFYIESQLDHTGELLQYCFKPYKRPDQYVAVVNGQVVLKSESECEPEERLFYVNEGNVNRDHLSFYVKMSGASHYLGFEETGELFATEAEIEEQGWIHMLGYEEKKITTVTKEELMFEPNLMDIIITEMSFSEE
ncbi:uncharacterized protein LOC114528819 [Dendronephthya gigantea]|uniref:uncharacterized protein LOC114528819 n=1 Tax=Dendronephthya gigantea TaxID=151771 RepID=UPI00106AC631|nr:uncharacterized protein LOC114528819 [Dendronephthya gigantea]